MDEVVELSEGLIRALSRSYHRTAIQRLRDAGRFTFVAGKRGIGKTTCLAQICAEHNAGAGRYPRALYLPMDHVRLRDMSMFDVAEWFTAMGGELLCVDEPHRSPGWAIALRGIYDSFPDLRVVASGATTIQLGRPGRDLSQHFVVERLPEFSFREFLELTCGETVPAFTIDDVMDDHVSIARRVVEILDATGHKVLPEFEEYLRVGSYPFHLDFKDSALFYRAVAQAMRMAIEVDVVAADTKFSGTSVRAMLRLLSFMSASVPLTPDMRKIRKHLGIGDERTLKQYLEYLADAGLLILLMPHDRKSSGLEKPDRIYLGDTTHLFAALGERASRDTAREIFFLQSLLPAHRVSASRHADFVVDGRWRVEIGGRNHSARPRGDNADAILAVGGTEIGADRRVPLWLFGCLR